MTHSRFEPGKRFRSERFVRYWTSQRPPPRTWRVINSSNLGQRRLRNVFLESDLCGGLFGNRVAKIAHVTFLPNAAVERPRDKVSGAPPHDGPLDLLVRRLAPRSS